MVRASREAVMPYANVRGVHINYKILGQRGPWIALSPGGRRDLSGIEPMARPLADLGYRVGVFDRRNCGASDVVIDGDDSEYEIWADDLYELLSQLGALPAIVGGSSSGCRTALLFALRHGAAARGLLLWRVTGGRFACERLAQEYYGQFIDAAKRGGMAAVCSMEHLERAHRCPAGQSSRADENGPGALHRRHVALARIFCPRRRPAGDRRDGSGASLDQSARLRRSGQRQHARAKDRRESRPPTRRRRSACAVVA